MNFRENSFDQIILVDKPAGISSFGIVARIRGKMSREKREIELAEFFAKNPELSRNFSDEQKSEFAKNPRGIPAEIREKISLTKKLKVGHAGTLDPFATGLLIILTGKKTREQDQFMKRDKTYLAKIKLGEISSTGDCEGEISRKISSKEEQDFARNLTREKIEKIISENFVGEITQIPPIYSAIKMDGMKAYEISRKAETDERFAEKLNVFREKFEREKARKITIHSCEVVDFQWPFLEIRAHVSSGTYIRTLAEGIGKKLKTGAFCAELRREKIADFDVKNAKNISEFDAKFREK